jgi:hypothetical protein
MMTTARQHLKRQRLKWNGLTAAISAGNDPGSRTAFIAAWDSGVADEEMEALGRLLGVSCEVLHTHGKCSNTTVAVLSRHGPFVDHEPYPWLRGTTDLIACKRAYDLCVTKEGLRARVSLVRAGGGGDPQSGG